MKIATWNINSVRLRIDQALQFLQQEQPDVFCLQEIKVANELFPAAPFRDLGYVHQAVHGQKAYNGVAILSRLPIVKSESLDFCREGHARHLVAHFENGVELHNFYVPAGGDVPDKELNPKFAHKLDFLARMKAYFAGRKDRASASAVLVGDLNIAPLENDVWSHKQLLNVVSHTPVETRTLLEIQAAFDFTDATRHFVPDTQKIYSWWSYRAADWNTSDRGRRLDHVWVSPALKASLSAQKIFRDMRGNTKASDHVPVAVELKL